MTTFRRTDFHILISPISFPMPIWKKQSRRSNRRKDVVKWARIAFECLEETLSLVAIHPKDHGNSVQTDVSFSIKERHMTSSSSVAPKSCNKRRKDIVEHLIQQLNYQKEHGLPSLADVPLHIEDTLMESLSYIVVEYPIKKTKDIAKLIKEMSRLNINRSVTTLGKTKKKLQLVTAKVDIDLETIKEWELLMENDLPGRSYADEETESKWNGEREIFQNRIKLFINRMHLLQGNRKFKQWKGSVVDSVVGVFLTQNVSDYLSSNAFISVAAKFPLDAKRGLECLPYYIEEPIEVDDSILDDQRPSHDRNIDAKSSVEFTSLPENMEEHEKVAKRKNKKTGIMEDEKIDWKNLRKMYTKKGSRDMMHVDTVDWDAVRSSSQQVLADTIIKRGQHNELSRKILKFLNNEANQNGVVDLEWLREAPSDLVKRYLLEIEGIGLKSAECVRLLGLKHSAFPVDTNVGRIAVRLGWVPLEPLPDGVQMHQLFHYPSMDSIQKYIWPRLCKLPQETLYELHYQMITFGKVFCTKVIPNCNACPMKSECKYFASAYVSSKVLLEGPKEKPHESDTSMPSTSDDVDVGDVNITSKITSIEECVSLECSNQTNCCEPVVEFPSSPRPEIPELIDIEDMPYRSPRRSCAEIPEIVMDMDAFNKNVVDAFLRSGKMLNSSNEEVSKALVVLTPKDACIPIKLPRKEKYYSRLRTEHVVYLLPDNHELLHDFEKREPDDPSPYLLALWQPGETSYSFTPPQKKCNSDGSNLCNIKTCSYCWSIREQSSNVYRGTILIPCRTATRGSFPLNGTYFQTNEVFADHETSWKPIVFPRELCDGLEKRALYCGSSVTSIFRLLDESRTRLCFWTGFVCMRAFNRKHRTPEDLVRRLHTPPDERGEKHMRDE
ncbi:DEMETER-like protein 3 [Eutrema salsugineum]|uniref:DEMETER-like protein 3 n=1 Tax=Eutrema salsugineum TaxID=72664 RepID=UPI000CED521E|nr:DEMETER-like protein 3 [Eutrema salsugineum]